MLPPRPFCSIALALALTTTTIHTANPPAWWSDPATAILQPGATPHDYSPATVGQLKFVATQAKKYLDIKLAAADGAGTVVNSVCQFGQQGNHSPLTLGQLKFVAKPFYDRSPPSATTGTRAPTAFQIRSTHGRRHRPRQRRSRHPRTTEVRLLLRIQPDIPHERHG